MCAKPRPLSLAIEETAMTDNLLAALAGATAAIALSSLPVMAANAGPDNVRAETRPLASPAIDAVVASAMSQFDVPGMAVAIVKDGKVLLAKGYGVRKA